MQKAGSGPTTAKDMVLRILGSPPGINTRILSKSQQKFQKWTDPWKRQRQQNVDLNKGIWKLLPGAVQMAVELFEKYEVDTTELQAIRWLWSGGT